MLSWTKKISIFYLISLFIIFLRLVLSPLKLSFEGVEWSLIMNSLVLAIAIIAGYLILESFHANNYKIDMWSAMEKVGIIIAIILIFNLILPSALFSFKYLYIVLHTLNLTMMLLGVLLTSRNKKKIGISFG